jgi:hypothetical protein
MSELIRVLVPYKQTFIPFRHRIAQCEVVWDFHRIEAHTISPESAPLAFRLEPVGPTHEDCAPDCVVRSFEGSYWWPLLGKNGAVSVAEFLSRAAEGRECVLTTLGCPLNFPLQGLGRRPSLDDLRIDFPKCRLVSSTFDTQANRINYGTDRIAFCDDKVLVAAGQPIYYAVARYGTDEFEILAGPSSLDPAPDRGYRLLGPDLFRRSAAAARGLAYAPDGLSRLEALLAESAGQAQQFSRIDRLIGHVDDPSPLTCARALAERLWRGVASGSAWDWPWLRSYVPSLAGAGEAGSNIESLPHRRTLEDLVSLDWASISDRLSREVRDASEILHRLDEIGHGILSKEEADALSSLRN